MLSEPVTQTFATGSDPALLVSYDGGSLLVRGPAGAGKTRLLLDRFCWLAAHGVAFERLALVAPSPARATAARQALEEQLPGGYSELLALTPVQLAGMIIRRADGDAGLEGALLSAGERLALLAARIDRLPLAHHDFGGNTGALLRRVLGRIDRLKAELISAAEFAAWASLGESLREREFAEIYRAYEQLLRDAHACDEADVLRAATALLADREPGPERHGKSLFEHVLIDDAQELALAPASLLRALGTDAQLTVAGDPLAGGGRFRGAGAARLESFERADTRCVTLSGSRRCAARVWEAACALCPDAGGSERAPEPAQTADDLAAVPLDGGQGDGRGEVEFWRCVGERAQAQAVAAEIERLLSRASLNPGQIAVIAPDTAREGRAVALALEQRGLPCRLLGEGMLFEHAEVRDLLAWLRLLRDPSDAAAVVRAIARAPIELRAIDIARCTQIARRRRLDMVAALRAAISSPQLPPAARERIQRFLELYRASLEQLDSATPDSYVQRLIARLGLRRTQLFAARAQAVEGLRALASFGELAAAYTARMPQSSAREFAAAVTRLAEYGVGAREQPLLRGAREVQIVSLDEAGGLEAEHVFVLGLGAELSGSAAFACEQVPDALLHERLPTDDLGCRRLRIRQRLYAALTRARVRAVLVHASDRALAPLEAARVALGEEWMTFDQQLFGPTETLPATYRLLRDELLEQTLRAGGRLAELRLDTDLDVSHAVVRYLELLKLAALIERPDAQGLSDALLDINTRIEQAITAEQREIYTSSPLDEYLLGVERDSRRRAQALAARDEPSLEHFLPLRGDGVLLSATDIETYRTCPLKYKFARVFRIPREPSLHQRFGIVVHQVLERYHAAGEPLRPLGELLRLLDECWRRGGLRDSEQERQLRQKATLALTRYHERAQQRAQHGEGEPVWFERAFSFRLGPHVVRGRVDRVDRLRSGEYELIDYKTGRPKTAAELADDVQLSLYGVAAREAWGLEATRGVYHYLLDDQRVAVGVEPARGEWVRTAALEVAEGILAQEFEPTPSQSACRLCDYRLICPAAER